MYTLLGGLMLCKMHSVHVPGEVHMTVHRLCINRLIFNFPSFQQKTRRMQRKKQPKQHLQDPWIFSTIEDAECWFLLMLYSYRKCTVQMFLQVVKRDFFSKYVDYVWKDNATIEFISRLCPNDAFVLLTVLEPIKISNKCHSACNLLLNLMGIHFYRKWNLWVVA